MAKMTAETTKIATVLRMLAVRPCTLSELAAATFGAETLRCLSVLGRDGLTRSECIEGVGVRFVLTPKGSAFVGTFARAA